jgi:hypothetical protein
MWCTTCLTSFPKNQWMKNHLPCCPGKGVVIHKPQNGSGGIKGLRVTRTI